MDGCLKLVDPSFPHKARSNSFVAMGNRSNSGCFFPASRSVVMVNLKYPKRDSYYFFSIYYKLMEGKKRY